MMLIYTHKISLRSKYIFNFFFTDIYDIPYQITQSKDEFNAYTGPKLNYSVEKIADELFVKAFGLLHEIGIKEQNIPVGMWNDEIILFKNNPGEEIPFDIFSAAFYLITRYEEYLPHITDLHNRFEAESSIAFQQQFLHKPIVNYWLNSLKIILLKRFPQLTFKEHHYSYISTIDIDNAFAFKQKGVMRTIGGYGRAIVNFFWEDFSERTKVLLGKMKDPYDTYDDQLEIQKKYNLKVIYFFLLGDYGVNDKNLPSNNKKFQALIKHLNDYADVGIHPSYGSNDNYNQVKKEINRLSTIVHRDIFKSRQHFLKLKFPTTYKTLVENGISDDYTMGYATTLGFRASVCMPFFWYDLDTETETTLKIHPFPIMEATLKFYMKENPDHSLHLIMPIINEVKKMNGQLITLWHNESMSNWREWKGWQNLYEQVVSLACKK
jgi:hypothetical protein